MGWDEWVISLESPGINGFCILGRKKSPTKNPIIIDQSASVTGHPNIL